MESGEMRVRNWKKCREGVGRYGLPALALLLIVLFYAFCSGRVRNEFPVLRSADGMLDIREVDFTADVYHVVNNWDYYPGSLFSPEDFADPAAAPAKHNDSPLDSEKGTWRLRLLAQPDTYLSICGFSIDYSTRVFVNGAEVRNIGFVSDDPAEAVPKVRYMTLPLYTGEDGSVEIVYQYANYVHHEGGFIQNTLMSTPENIDEYQRTLSLNAMVVSSGLLMLCFYFLLCEAYQKNREYAALALCCLVIALRNQFFFVQHLLPENLSFYIEYRLVILDVSMIPMATVFLFGAFFPRSAGKRTMGAFAGLCLILSALHFVADTHDLVLLCHVCYYTCVPFALWVLIRQLLDFRRRKPGAMDMITVAAILFFTFMLIREGMSTGSDSTVNHFGITPLAMLICILLLAIVSNERISRQTVQLREERQRNELLLQMNATNNDFLRTVAHELKTPLTVISGYAQLMERQLERGPLSEKAPERLQTIRSEADRLAEMVTQLMDYTYEHVKDAEMTGVEIDDLFRSAAAIMEPVCARKHNTLTVHNEATSPVHGNAELLLQVLINLIVNASRHTEAGRITVTAADSAGFAEITVADTGIGVAAEAVPHIFEKGYSTDGSRGLGLAICMDTVRMHGGTLELAHTGPEGTVFRFTVPKEAAL